MYKWTLENQFIGFKLRSFNTLSNIRFLLSGYQMWHLRLWLNSIEEILKHSI